MSPFRRTHRALAALLAVAVLVPASPARAATPGVVGVTCTATANLPTLNSKRQLAGSGAVTCTNSTRSIQYLTVRVTVYEYQSKGVVYNYMGYTYSVVKSFSLKAGAKATWKVATTARTCQDQEVGNDDYGSEVVVNPSAPIAISRRHAIDGYRC